MELTALLAVIGALFAAPRATALSSTDAKTVYDAFNNAFLYTSGDTAYYKRALTDNAYDGSWTFSQDIFLAQDVYELSGDADQLALMTNLLNTWVNDNPPPWDGDTWNDDIGWDTLGLMRGYQFTGNQTWYDMAKAGYDMAFARGWDTAHNNGGIWELQPAKGAPPATKCVLSNFSLSRVAAMIYQATHDQTYLDQCVQIYNWVYDTFFNPTTGEVIGCIVETGQLQYGDNGYDQGLLADQANMLWLITGNDTYLETAKLAMNYAFSNVTTNGIFTTWDATGSGYVDDLSRGVGRTVQNNRLWDTYHSQMVANAESILANRRPDLGITWNAWDKPTPENIDLWPTQAVDAATWVQWVPPNIPDDDIGGIHTITNVQTGHAIDSAGTLGNGDSIVQAELSGQQEQRWLLTPNSDGSWNILNLGSWKALDCPGGQSTEELTMIQWRHHRQSNQRWMVEQQSDGSYKISNKQSQLALDGSSKAAGSPLTQAAWNGAGEQLWLLK